MKKLSLLILSVLFIVQSSLAQGITLPTNPLKGRIVFEEKGCISCHSISGFGGDQGPDLGRDHYYGSILELASIIWNHLPSMNRRYRELGIKKPHFTESDMLNLIGFLYYLRYLGEPGSVLNGGRLLNDKGCLNCHEITGTVEKKGPAFDQLKQYASPLYMVQAMWNHGPKMQEEMQDLGIQYPTLKGQDIVDITSFIRQSTIGNTEIRMSPGNPVNGEIIFKEKHCNSCHSVGQNDSAMNYNLGNIDLKKSVNEIAGIMWNHSPIMIDQMKSKSIAWPEFKGKEMADLIAYLYFLGFEDKLGNAENGEKIFNEKKCLSCHDVKVGIGPELSKIKHLNSPIRMIQLMWNHADRMDDLLLIKNEGWPMLTTIDMQNLFAYLQKITFRK